MLMGTSGWGVSIVFLAAFAAVGPLRAPPTAAAEPQNAQAPAKPSEPTRPSEPPEFPKPTKTPKTQASPASKAPQEDAVRSFEEGVAAAKAEDWPGAERAFLRAWRSRRHWQIAANLGRAELMNGRHCDAAEHLSYVLNEAKDLSQTDRAKMRELLDKALAQVGLLAIEVNTKGADVRVDGALIGPSPLRKEVCVEPGLRTIAARQGSGAPVSESVYLRAGSTRAVALRIEPARPSSAKNTLIGVGIAATAVTAAIGAASLVYAFTSLKDRDAANDGLSHDASPEREERAHRVGIEHGEYVASMNIGVASLIAAGAFGVTTLVYGIAAPSAKAPSADAALSFGLGIGKSSGRFAVTYAW
jgi:hypothetical protein